MAKPGRSLEIAVCLRISGKQQMLSIGQRRDDT